MQKGMRHTDYTTSIYINRMYVGAIHRYLSPKRTENDGQNVITYYLFAYCFCLPSIGSWESNIFFAIYINTSIIFVCIVISVNFFTYVRIISAYVGLQSVSSAKIEKTGFFFSSIVSQMLFIGKKNRMVSISFRLYINTILTFYSIASISTHIKNTQTIPFNIWCVWVFFTIFVVSFPQTHVHSTILQNNKYSENVNHLQNMRDNKNEIERYIWLFCSQNATGKKRRRNKKKNMDKQKVYLGQITYRYTIWIYEMETAYCFCYKQNMFQIWNCFVSPLWRWI